MDIVKKHRKSRGFLLQNQYVFCRVYTHSIDLPALLYGHEDCRS